MSQEPAKRQRTEAPLQTRIFVKRDSFEAWLSEVLKARGFDAEEARAAASWGARTAEYEVETHGARKLLSLLDHEFARSGSCVAQVQHRVLLHAGSIEVWDGARKLGPAIATKAQARAVELAEGHGIGIVTVRECNHFGWGPAYALQQLEDKPHMLVGNATQGAIPIVTPIGGAKPTVGSNALAVVLSTGIESNPVFLWDTGTAAMSWGEVQKLRLEGGGLRPNSAVDKHGHPAEQASDAACLLPAGTIGNALGMLIELLAANVGAGDPRKRSASPDEVSTDEPNTCVFCFFALDLSLFDKLDFPGARSRTENMARMVESIFEGNGSARMVGERKMRAKARSRQHGGLLFAVESITAFKEEAERRNIAFPEAREVELAMEEVFVASK